MTRTILLTLFAATGLTACSDPGAKVEAARVSDPAPSAAAPAVPEPTGGLKNLAITPGNSKIEWVGAKVSKSHPGGFHDFRGTINLDATSSEKSRVDVAIKTASLFTDSERLAGHLRSPDFFDVAQFPEATFKSTSITARADGDNSHLIEGDLTLRGITRRISFPAKVSVGTNVAVAAEFSINRKDFQIIYPGMPDDLIRDLVVIKLTLDVPRAG